jgi:CheY-like chemotaxis protein
LWLPRAPSGRKVEAASTAEPEQSRSMRSLRILLVDDHAEVRTSTTAMLEDLGHTVTEAADGAEALAALRDGACECDLMISDYAMPHLSGTEFLRAAREICPDVPALIITGYAAADAIRDRPNGVDVLLKPFTSSMLEAAVARVCVGAATAVG